MKSMSSRLVSIVIVTTGLKGYINSCLDSIKEQVYPNLEVLVMDNSLNQNFGQDLNKNYPYIKLSSSSKNLFYCRALNKAIELSKGDFILCLNDDVILDKRFIEEALKGFDINKRIGMVSGRILRYDGKTIDSTGLFLSCFRTAKERGYGCKDKGQFEKAGYIFGVNGAVAFYRKEMFDEIKIGSEYFDSDLRFFYEDLDIAWRAKNFGWKGYYIPSAVAYHLRGATVRYKSGINKKFARFYINDELHFDLIKNRYLTIIKNENFLDFLLHLPFIMLYDITVWGFIFLLRISLIKELLKKTIPIGSAFRKRELLKKQKLI